MRELIETERMYVEELLSVLLVRKHTFLFFMSHKSEKNITVNSSVFTAYLLLVQLLLVIVHLHKPFIYIVLP